MLFFLFSFIFPLPLKLACVGTGLVRGKDGSPCLVCAFEGGRKFAKGASVSFADQVILVYLVTIRQGNTFSSANIYDMNNLSLSPRNYLAINSSFVSQDAFGKDFWV